MTVVFNLLLYEFGWFACVLGAANLRPWLGTSIAMGLVAVHWLLARNRRSEVMLGLAAATVGLVADTGQLWLGVFDFASGTVWPGLVPPWIVVMWLQFATTFRYSLRWLSHRYLLAAVLGTIGGPLAFLAGERLGAVTFAPPRYVSYGILAAVWTAALPLLVWLSDRSRNGSGESPGYRWLSK